MRACWVAVVGAAPAIPTLRMPSPLLRTPSLAVCGHSDGHFIFCRYCYPASIRTSNPPSSAPSRLLSHGQGPLNISDTYEALHNHNLSLASRFVSEHTYPSARSSYHEHRASRGSLEGPTRRLNTDSIHGYRTRAPAHTCAGTVHAVLPLNYLVTSPLRLREP